MFQQCPIGVRIFSSVFSVPVHCRQVTDTSSKQTVDRNRCNNSINEGSGRERH